MYNNCKCSCGATPAAAGQTVFIVGQTYVTRNGCPLKVVEVRSNHLVAVDPNDPRQYRYTRQLNGWQWGSDGTHGDDLVGVYVAPPPRRIRYQNIYSKQKQGSVIGNGLYGTRQAADASANDYKDRIAIMTVEVDEKNNVIAIDKIECV